MAIPLSDLQKEIRVPNAVLGQAPDVSQAAVSAAKLAESTYRGLLDLGSGAAGLAFQYNRAKNLQVGQDLLTEYRQILTDENAKVSQMGPQEAAAYQSTYNKIVTAAHNKFLGGLEQMDDNEVREDMRTKANDINLSNRNQSAQLFDKANREWQKLSAQNATEMLIAEHKGDILNNTYSNEQVYLLTKDKSRQILENTRTELAAQGIYDNDYVNGQAQAKIEKLFEQASRAMNERNTNYGKWQATPGQSIIEWGLREGILSAEFAQPILVDYDKRNLALVAMQSPGDFFDNNGNFIKEDRRRNCRFLDRYEYEFALRQALASYKPGLNGPAGLLKQAMWSEYDRWMKDWLAKRGQFDKDSVEEYIRQRSAVDGKVLTKEEALKELQANVNPEDITPMNFVNLGNTLSKMQSTWMLVDNQNGLALGITDEDGIDLSNVEGAKAAKKMTLKEMQNLVISDPHRFTLFQPLADYQPLAADRVETENRFTTMMAALGKSGAVRDPGRAVGRKDEEGYYRTNNQERGLAILSYLNDSIPMSASQIYGIMGTFNELLPQNIVTKETRTNDNGGLQYATISGLDPYGFVDDDDQLSREVISEKIIASMSKHLTDAQITKAKQALESRPFMQYVWTPSRGDMQNAAYVAPKLNAWAAPMMGAASSTYLKNAQTAAARANMLEGYMTEHRKLYNKTYQAQNATKTWAAAEVEKNKNTKGLTEAQIHQAANELNAAKKQRRR